MYLQFYDIFTDCDILPTRRSQIKIDGFSQRWAPTVFLIYIYDNVNQFSNVYLPIHSISMDNQ